MPAAPLAPRAAPVQLQRGGGRGPDVPDLPAALRAAGGHALRTHLLPRLHEQLPQGEPPNMEKEIHCISPQNGFCISGEPDVPARPETRQRDVDLAVELGPEKVREDGRERGRES